jgi:hypothetical protein
MGMARDFCIAAMGLLFATHAQAHSLCGMQYRSNAGLAASLRADENSNVFDGMRLLTVIRDHTFWAITKPSDPAYPAVACVQQVVRDQGYERRPVQSICGRAPRKACAALIDEVSKAKF